MNNSIGAVESQNNNVAPSGKDAVEECGEGIIKEDDAMDEDASKARQQQAREDGVPKVKGEVGGVKEVECRLLSDGEAQGGNDLLAHKLQYNGYVVADG